MSETIIRRLGGDDAVDAVASLLVLPYIWDNLDDCFHSLHGIFRLLRAVEDGRMRCYAAIDGTELVGAIVGEEQDGMFDGHFLMRLHRSADLTRLRDRLLAAIRDDHAADGRSVTAFRGRVPETNRACQRACRRLGAKDMGIGDALFMRDGRAVPCRDFILKLEDVWPSHQ